MPGLPDTVPSRALFYLAPDAGVWDFLTGGQLPDWGAGVAIPARQMVVIPLFEAPAGGLRERDRTTLHEWAHLGLHEHLDGLRVPRWFDEGYAQRASGGWNVQEAWRLRLGLARGGAPPLDSLTLDWPRGRTGAELAYLLAGSAVEYLASESGERGLDLFLGRWRETWRLRGGVPKNLRLYDWSLRDTLDGVRASAVRLDPLADADGSVLGVRRARPAFACPPTHSAQSRATGAITCFRASLPACVLGGSSRVPRSVGSALTRRVETEVDRTWGYG